MAPLQRAILFLLLRFAAIATARSGDARPPLGLQGNLFLRVAKKYLNSRTDRSSHTLVMPKLTECSDYYNHIYKNSHHNFYKRRRWMFQPFIQALAQKAQLPRQSKIIDLGCGLGLFTSLFAELGFQTLGVDLSSEAIKSAKQQYSSTGAKFEVGDVLSLPYKNSFDCAFVRSCTLYNCADFESNHQITDIFLSYLKPGGTFIFLYNTKLSPFKHDPTMIYHSFNSLKKHFSSFPQAKSFFSLRLDTLLLHSLAFSPPFTSLDILISTCTGLGGDLIAILKKT
jgi:SAM-dependent methyltransferase